MPKRLNKFEYVPSVGAVGGLLVAWNDKIFEGNKVFQNTFALSIEFTTNFNGNKWTLTNIYGPCQNDRRSEFLDWFQSINMPTDWDWLVVGGFNYIRYPSNRSRPGGHIQDMMNFNAAISNVGLVEIPLKGGSFTWSNMQ